MKMRLNGRLLSQYRFGRLLLHLACAVRDHHWSWHLAGIRREFARQ